MGSSTQITMGEIKMKEGWMKGERQTDERRRRRVGQNSSQGKKQGNEGMQGERGGGGRYLNASQQYRGGKNVCTQQKYTWV